jgi:hypothetical protein
MIFVSTLYYVRSGVQGTERVKSEQDRQSKYKHDIEARSINKFCHGKAIKSGVYLRFYHVYEYTAKDSIHLIN